MAVGGDEHSGDGSESFWPGYVDAVTNLVLNLLFLLTIMTVAVFMFALELGRASLGGSGKKAAQVSGAESSATVKSLDSGIEEREASVRKLKMQVDALSRQTPTDVGDLQKKVEAINAALNSEVQVLSEMRARQAAIAASATKLVPATVAVAKPVRGLEKTVVDDAEVVVRFVDEAVTLNQQEKSQLRSALQSVVKKGRARIDVEVPKGFSEAKRLGFYRAMEVRNMLLELKLPQDRIEVAVREGRRSANAAIVRVSGR